MGNKTRNAPKDEEQAKPTPAPANRRNEAESEKSLDDRLDEALSESFPASDPPAVHRLSSGRPYLP
ncbi:MAG TPA: hypothetical protein VMF03_01150 [Steroidobacteraceae bacterium]|nr:hypothetical protein [Steroidobacteraceae bacterium]